MKFINCILFIGMCICHVSCKTSIENRNNDQKTEQRLKARMLNDSSCTLIMRNLGNQDTLLRCIALLKESIKTDSSYSMAYSNIIDRYLEDGDTINSIKYINLLAVQKPKLSILFLKKGVLLKSIHQDSSAKINFKRGLALVSEQLKKKSDSADLLMQHAMLLHYLGNEEKSKQETEILIQKYPEHKPLVDAWYNELKH